MKGKSDKILQRTRVLGYFIFVLTLSMAVLSCSQKDFEETEVEIIQTDVETEVATESTEPIAESIPEESITEIPTERLKEYSITAGDDFVALLDWDDVIDLYALLGEPLNEEVIVLGQDSDTFTGSYLKTMQYDGLEIKLFSPKDNGSSFWVMEIIVSGGEYATYQGIKIGDTLSVLKDKYPSISRVEDGRTDDNNCAYEIADLENYNYLSFEVNNSLVSLIRLFRMIP